MPGRWTRAMPPGAIALAPPEQRVDERPVGVPRRRVDDEAGRLVDDEQVVVLVDDVDRDLRLGDRLGRRGRRDDELQVGAGLRRSCSPSRGCPATVSRPSEISRWT